MMALRTEQLTVDVRFEFEVFYNDGQRYPAMLRDTVLPAIFPYSREPVFRAVERPGVRYSAARWTPEALGRVVAALRKGRKRCGRSRMTICSPLGGIRFRCFCAPCR